MLFNRHPIRVSRSLLPFLATLVVASLAPHARGQGCVIARGGGGLGLTGASSYLEAGDWQVGVAHRWLYSDRHFVGRDEQPHRQDGRTAVINNSHFLDVTATYAVSPRLSAYLALPFSYHDRSSLYEHLGNSSGQRFHSQAGGLGDIRFGGSWWFLDPATHPRGNVAGGLGLKLPTGDYKATDTFIRSAGPTLRYVDSSIQPGDGGFGFTFDLRGFYHLGGPISAYGEGFYVFNPREQVVATGYSVPDSYMVRAGLDATTGLTGLIVSLGARWEGVPPEDAFGGSRGSRRPGYSLGVEPGINYSRGRYQLSVTVPIALLRNRQRTFGASRTGDAAFADYTVNSSLVVRF